MEMSLDFNNIYIYPLGESGTVTNFIGPFEGNISVNNVMHIWVNGYMNICTNIYFCHHTRGKIYRYVVGLNTLSK